MHLVGPAAKSNLTALCPHWVFLFHFVDWLLARFDWMRPTLPSNLLSLCVHLPFTRGTPWCEPHAWLLQGLNVPLVLQQ